MEKEIFYLLEKNYIEGRCVIQGGTRNDIQGGARNDIQGGARNDIPLIVHVTHFYHYKNI